MNRRQSLRVLGTTAAWAATRPSYAATQSNQPAWRRGSDLPLAVQEIYPAAHQGEIYVAGGIGSRLSVPFFTDRCIAYNPDSDAWRDIAKLPKAIHHAALVSTGKRLLLIGGFYGSYTNIWQMHGSIFELFANGWIEVGQLPKPQAEGVLSLAPDKQIHLVTGQHPKAPANNSKRSDHHAVTSHWFCDGDVSRWHAAAPIPTPRNSATGGWVNGQLVVAGGRTAQGNLTTTQIYDKATDRWTTARPMPLAQAGTASVVAGDNLIVFGGEIFTPSEAVFKEVWRYHLPSDTWHALPNLPTPRHGLGAVKLGNQAFVIAGATKPSGSGTSPVLEILDLASF